MTGREELLGRLELEVAMLVRRLRRVVTERAALVHADLQPAAYLVLAHLHAHGPSRSSTLAERLALDKGAVSRHAQHLVDLGLVERQSDPADGRATILTATREAGVLVEAVHAARHKELDRRVAEWSEEELAGFVAALSRFNHSLEEPAATAPGRGRLCGEVISAARRRCWPAAARRGSGRWPPADHRRAAPPGWRRS